MCVDREDGYDKSFGLTKLFFFKSLLCGCGFYNGVVKRKIPTPVIHHSMYLLRVFKKT